MGRRLLIATLLLAAVAPPARAAEISIASSCEPSGSKEPCVFVSRLRYTAAPGESNDLSLANDLAGRTFRDRVPVIAPPPCAARPDGAVACPSSPVRVVLDGGAGTDEVSYFGHRAPVRVDLGTPVGGDGDRLTGFEAATGGAGDDVLIGDAGPNRLGGWGGRDTLLAAGGDDLLEGGGLADLLVAGPGDDTLNGGTGLDRHSAGAGDDELQLLGSRLHEGIACGRGRDLVSRPGLALLPRSCELADGNPVYPRVGRPGALTFTLVGAERMRRGRLELRLRGRERRFAVARFAVGRETVRLRVRVPPRIRRLRRWRLPVEVRVVGRDENPHFTPHRERWVFDLAAAR